VEASDPAPAAPPQVIIQPAAPQTTTIVKEIHHHHDKRPEKIIVERKPRPRRPRRSGPGCLSRLIMLVREIIHKYGYYLIAGFCFYVFCINMPETRTVYKDRIEYVENIKEVQIEVIKEIEKIKTVEVPKEVIEYITETIVEVVEVPKEVIVEKIVEKIQRVEVPKIEYRDVPRTEYKTIYKDVIKEVVKYVDREIPVYRDRIKIDDPYPPPSGRKPIPSPHPCDKIVPKTEIGAFIPAWLGKDGFGGENNLNDLNCLAELLKWDVNAHDGIGAYTQDEMSQYSKQYVRSKMGDGQWMGDHSRDAYGTPIGILSSDNEKGWYHR